MRQFARLMCGLIALSFAATAMAAQPAAKPKGPTPDEVKKIEAAIDAGVKARVAPAKPRRVLIFSISWGYWHDSIPYGAVVFQNLGRKTGAFEPVLSDNLANFEPDKINQFDAIIFNNTNNEIFLPNEVEKLPPDQQKAAIDRDSRLKKSFVNWLQAGHGLFVIHAGVASFRKWDEYGNIVGARFTNHPWTSGSTVGMKVEEPNHPLAAALREPRFKITDEIYQMTTPPYSRDNLRVLVSIDTSAADMTKKGIVRTDGDFAMTWIKTYGQGRVFYNAWGHDHPLFWTPMVLQHWLDGIQYATGDLKADATPRR